MKLFAHTPLHQEAEKRQEVGSAMKLMICPIATHFLYLGHTS